MGSTQKEKKGGEESQQQNVQSKNKKRKEIFPYGNYKNYYGYRIGQELEEDPRLKVFKKEWFVGKDCLDIGCNSGMITIQIAKRFCCQSILGVDIDANRIQDAYWHLRKFMKMDTARKASGKASKLEGANGSESSVNGSINEEVKETPSNCSSEEKDLFDVVSFRKEDFVNSRDPPKNQYDTIICLSVSKWIHLNWGDDGLITLFTKVWRLLRPTTRTNYKNIIFHPSHFQDLLLDKIGFRTVEDITSSVSGSKSGFNRPILVFHK